MDLNECKNCKYCILEVTASERYYVCMCNEYSSSFPEFDGKCKYKESLIDKKKLEFIRRYLIENVFRNPNIMLNEEINNYDIPEIICGLYEYLHRLLTNEEYDYMWHWANKCGSWVETYSFDKTIERIIKEGEKNED